MENLPSYRYPVEELLKEFSEPTPPGAGGAASLLGAIAASLVSKSARLTLGREGFDAVSEEMQRIVSRAATLGSQCEELIDQDPTAMNRLSASAALPQGTPEEQEIRRTCIQTALKNAVQIPLVVAQHSLEVLSLAEAVVRYGAPRGAAEAMLAVRTAASALDGSLLAAMSMLPTIEDEAFKQEQVEKARSLRDQGNAIEQELRKRAWDQLLV